jgi:alpha-tubulin suppressor-like RCC1 family protein
MSLVLVSDQTGIPQVTAVAAGSLHSLVLDVGGDVWPWGCRAPRSLTL